jgi:NAD(P)-dependent dehydrogenase (short-subunit alcohol dehydrogenase family)
MPAELLLDGRVAIVTGAAGKLGSAFCNALADAGARVAGIDLHGGTHAADVTDRQSLEAARGAIERDLGPAAILVNAAGIDQPPDAAAATYLPEDVPLDEFRRTLDVNLAGTFLSIQVFGSRMRDGGGGSIVNIGSLYGSIAAEPAFYDHLDVQPAFLKPAAYGASKAGVLNLTRYFARLWGPHGVRVNALSPGGVRGDQDPEFTVKYCARVPLGRMADAGDLTGPLLFLTSDASRYVTGQELRVDGGFTA